MTRLRQPLTDAQLEILALFSEKLSKEELEDLRKWLLEFRYHRLQKTLDKSAKEKGWTEDTFEKWSKIKFRIPYKSQLAHTSNVTDENRHSTYGFSVHSI